MARPLPHRRSGTGIGSTAIRSASSEADPFQSNPFHSIPVMKLHAFRSAGLACALLLAGTGTSPAEHTVYRGTTTIRWERLNYLASTGITTETRGVQKLQQIGISSSLGNTGYALYTLDNRTKVAAKATGNFAKGPVIFQNYRNSGLGYEVHKQFNASWSEDIPGLGDTEDIWNRKTGDFGGPRSMVPLPAAGFSIEAARKLSGFHTHTVCSEDFGIDPVAASGYSTGRFFQVNSSKSTFKLDLKLTDKANDMGGSLTDAITVTEADLVLRGFTIMMVPALPF
jgi:hypothetical protein